MPSLYDFDDEFAQTYTEECECGNKIEVETETEEDEQPEYHTEIFVKCSCGKSVAFILPVN